MIERLPRWIYVLAVAGIVVLTVWQIRRWAPARYVPARFETLVGRVEANRWWMAGWLVADDYTDRWGFDKKTLLDSGQSVFRHFRWIEMGRRDESWSFTSDTATVTVTLDLRGEGTQLAIIAKDAASEATAPFVFSWRKTGPMPWQWQLASMDQPQLNLRRWQGSL